MAMIAPQEVGRSEDAQTGATTVQEPPKPNLNSFGDFAR